MIFQPATLAAIKARRKSRLTLPADTNPRCPFTPGRLYRAWSRNAGWTAAELADHRQWAQDEMPTRARAVLAYLDEPVDHAFTAPKPIDVTVLEAHLSTLGHTDHQAARREGFQVLDQFVTWWRCEHGAWEPDRPIWVIGFAVGDLRDRFDVPRLLKATPGHAGEDAAEHQDYTSRPALAMSHEPEAVDARSLERFAAEGMAGHARRKTAELRSRHVRTLTVRLRDAERAEDWEEYRRLLGELHRVAA